MRVMHVITGLNDGGAEAVLHRLCTTDRNCQHHVVSMMDEGKYGPLLDAAGIQVTCLGMAQGKLSPAGLQALWCALRNWRPTVVQTWMYHADLVGGIMARLAGVKRIYWGIHNSALDPKRAKWGTITVARINARLSHHVPTAIACCAERAREVHVTLGYATEKLEVIYNGYDVSRFRPDDDAGATQREEWGISGNLPLIGMVGRYDSEKDHDNLLCALARLKEAGADFRCVLVGRGLDGNNRPLAARIENLSLTNNILLAGQSNDIPAVMNALDLHVLSSAAEAFPNVLAEAMACGTPCVSTEVGDAATIVGDTGWLVPPRDSDALAAAIGAALALRADAAAWQARSRAARAHVKALFGLDRMVAAYNVLWRRETA